MTTGRLPDWFNADHQVIGGPADAQMLLGHRFFGLVPDDVLAVRYFDHGLGTRRVHPIYIHNLDHIWHPLHIPDPTVAQIPRVNHNIPQPAGWIGDFNTTIIIPTSNTPISLLMGDDNAFQENRREYNRLVQKVPLDLISWQEKHNIYTQYEADYQEWLTIPRLAYENLFTREYLKSFELDIQTLKVYILDFFNSYVIDNPTVTQTKLDECGDGTVSYVTKRKMITMQELEEQYSDAYWIKFYASLRTLEAGKSFDKTAMENFFTRIKHLLAQIPGDEGEKRVVKIIAEDTKGVLKEKLRLTPPAKDDKIKTDSSNQPTTIQDVLNHIKNDDELI